MQAQPISYAWCCEKWIFQDFRLETEAAFQDGGYVAGVFDGVLQVAEFAVLVGGDSEKDGEVFAGAEYGGGSRAAAAVEGGDAKQQEIQDCFFHCMFYLFWPWHWEYMGVRDAERGSALLRACQPKSGISIAGIRFGPAYFDGASLPVLAIVSAAASHPVFPC